MLAQQAHDGRGRGTPPAGSGGREAPHQGRGDRGRQAQEPGVAQPGRAAAAAEGPTAPAAADATAADRPAALDQHQAHQQRTQSEPQIAGADVGAHPEAALGGRGGLGHQRGADRMEQRRPRARGHHGQAEAREAGRAAQGRRAQPRQHHARPRHPAATARLVSPVPEQRLQDRRDQQLQAD